MTQAATLVKPEHHLHLMKTKKSLLVIEDDLSMIQFIDTILDDMHEDLDWEYVTSGEAAIDLIKRRGTFRGDSPYDLVITDIFLEGETNGIDVWIECQKRFPDMPFIMTSSLSLDRFAQILRGVGNRPVYMPKPLSVNRFQTIFKEYL
jgi:DNA-binding NtrC family response regulator